MTCSGVSTVSEHLHPHALIPKTNLQKVTSPNNTKILLICSKTLGAIVPTVPEIRAKSTSARSPCQGQ